MQSFCGFFLSSSIVPWRYHCQRNSVGDHDSCSYSSSLFYYLIFCSRFSTFASLFFHCNFFSSSLLPVFFFLFLTCAFFLTSIVKPSFRISYGFLFFFFPPCPFKCVFYFIFRHLIASTIPPVFFRLIIVFWRIFDIDIYTVYMYICTCTFAFRMCLIKIIRSFLISFLGLIYSVFKWQ